MNTKLVNYIRKYYSWEIPGKKEAMQIYRAAYEQLNDKWPDYEVVAELKGSYSKAKLISMYGAWESEFESLAEDFYVKHKDSGKFNFCPSCGEIARSPTFERCEECGHTWKLSNAEKHS